MPAKEYIPWVATAMTLCHSRKPPAEQFTGEPAGSPPWTTSSPWTASSGEARPVSAAYILPALVDAPAS